MRWPLWHDYQIFWFAWLHMPFQCPLLVHIFISCFQSIINRYSICLFFFKEYCFLTIISVSCILHHMIKNNQVLSVAPDQFLQLMSIYHNTINKTYRTNSKNKTCYNIWKSRFKYQHYISHYHWWKNLWCKISTIKYT